MDVFIEVLTLDKVFLRISMHFITMRLHVQRCVYGVPTFQLSKTKQKKEIKRGAIKDFKFWKVEI